MGKERKERWLKQEKAIFLFSHLNDRWMGCVVSSSVHATEAVVEHPNPSEEQRDHRRKDDDSENIEPEVYCEGNNNQFFRKKFCSTDIEDSAESEELISSFSEPDYYHQSPILASAMSQPRFSIDTSRAKSNAFVVSHCAQKLGIGEFAEGRMDGKSCDIYWHSVVYADMKSVVKGGGRVNKFPGMTELAKKIALTQAIHSMRQLFPAEYSFYPQSWILPAQLNEFKAYCEQHKELKPLCFIVKPDEGAQGTGIYLAETDEQLKESQSKQLVQEYVADPYLLPDGLKFDLRVYAVIKSINPLSIFVAREGMARFCTEKYVRPCPGNFDNLYAHLTNYSLNKASDAYVHSKSLREQLKGSKRLLSTVFHQMEHKGVRTRRLWREIKLIIAKTCLAMVPEIMLNYEHNFGSLQGNMAPQCFQIMGFDILIRNDGHPVLLEVNSAPSLSVGHSLGQHDEASTEPGEAEQTAVRSIVDEMIKFPLVRDCLLLVLDQLDAFYPAARNKNANKMPSTARKSKNSGDEGNSRKWEVHSLDSMGTGITAGSALTNTNIDRRINSEDDLVLLNRLHRPHLSEIFPSRYGQVSKHLLVLDRAVYLYLHFLTIRQSLQISLTTLKAFLKKCGLTDTMSVVELEAEFSAIGLYFGSKPIASGAPALPFHGFLQLFFHIAKRKFPSKDNLLNSVIQLFAHCDQSLRRFGVRSSRLRHTELMEEEQQKDEENSDRSTEKTANKNSSVKIYLLPSRMPRRPLQTNNDNGGKDGIPANSRKRTQQPNRTRSLPRKFGAAAASV